MLLNSAVLEVIVGLFFVYLLLALICSAISEWTAGILALRARMLREASSMSCSFAGGGGSSQMISVDRKRWVGFHDDLLICSV